MYIDIKETIWERIFVPKEFEEKILEYLKSKRNPTDIVSDLFNEGANSEFIYETSEFIEPIETATLEVYEGYGDLIYSNFKK